MRKRGLGRGLSDLLSGEALSQSRAVIEVPLGEIEPNPNQPRQDFNEDALEELTLSIEVHGVLQPIIVRRTGPTYQIVAGERRWRAAQRAGLQTIPCLVQDADDNQALELAMIENLQRDDLGALEAARGYRMLINDFNLTQEEVAQRVGKSRSAVANTLRLLELPDSVQMHLREGRLSEGHGRALLPLVSQSEQLAEALGRVVDEGLNVRETERLVRDTLNPPDPETVAVAPESVEAEPRTRRSSHDLARDPHVAAAEQRLQMALATKIAIRPAARRGGVIHIRYYELEDLERLITMLEMAKPEGETAD
jgi:ParB family chromosome partitioning protein